MESKRKKMGRPKKRKSDITQQLNLRLPSEIVDKIDDLCEQSITIPSRHAWLVEAVIEKLSKEEDDETAYILANPTLVQKIEQGLRELRERKVYQLEPNDLARIENT